MLISSRHSWHTEMAKWIAEARAAELEEDSNDECEAPEPAVNDHGWLHLQMETNDVDDPFQWPETAPLTTKSHGN